MKNLLLLLTLLILAGCKECEKCDPCPQQTAASAQLCNDPVNREIRLNSAIWCQRDMTGYHEIDEVAFNGYLTNRWQNNVPKAKFIYWNDIYDLIKNVKCYEKYVRFTFDADAEDNYSIRPVLVDCYDPTKSCYSIPFLKKLAENHRLGSGDVFECSIAQESGKPQSVIFSVMDQSMISPKRRFYDISHDPKILSLVKDHDSKK